MPSRKENASLFIQELGRDLEELEANYQKSLLLLPKAISEEEPAPQDTEQTSGQEEGE